MDGRVQSGGGVPLQNDGVHSQMFNTLRERLLKLRSATSMMRGLNCITGDVESALEYVSNQNDTFVLSDFIRALLDSSSGTTNVRNTRRVRQGRGTASGDQWLRRGTLDPYTYYLLLHGIAILLNSKYRSAVCVGLEATAMWFANLASKIRRYNSSAKGPNTGTRVEKINRKLFQDSQAELRVVRDRVAKLAGAEPRYFSEMLSGAVGEAIFDPESAPAADGGTGGNTAAGVMASAVQRAHVTVARAVG
eukprot:TRINITY_DN5504_c0_g1_i1.p1 TRINITY_DN5504_c0_g1~~TRINITY_DN5504_c0_g1_i1.p1  ORF type:complete len:249 (-),score=36.69 TRINITY_DN5504_c0_g1_i1:83-829(-)